MVFVGVGSVWYVWFEADEMVEALWKFVPVINGDQARTDFNRKGSDSKLFVRAQGGSPMRSLIKSLLSLVKKREAHCFGGLPSQVR